MALRIDDKKTVVAEVADVAEKAFSVVAAEYIGLTVIEMTELREKARESGVYLRVVKNTLAKRAFEGTEFECMRDGLVGPLILALSMEDLGSAARVIKDFSEDHEKLQTKLVSLGGQVYGSEELSRVASLPTRDQAIGILMGVMKAPIEKFVRTLNEPHAKLTRTLAAVGDQKQAAA